MARLVITDSPKPRLEIVEPRTRRRITPEEVEKGLGAERVGKISSGGLTDFGLCPATRVVPSAAIDGRATGPRRHRHEAEGPHEAITVEETRAAGRVGQRR
jgi:hypothetical protein